MVLRTVFAILAVSAFCALSVLGQSTTLPPILDPEAAVEIPELGKIQGASWYTSTTTRKFHVFHGIPYAHSPEGERRFKPSLLKDDALTDDGTPFVAWNPMVLCPQGMFTNNKAKKLNETDDLLLNIIRNGMWKMHADYKEPTAEDFARQEDPIFKESEDCLVLNINTPRIPKEGDELMPIIFFIHGGSSTQMWGSPFTGLRFLEHDVILVTINYRLGVLGALNLGIDEAPGNAAMYDTLTALDWVHKYIHYFGGDKNRITLYGHSAGSMMVTHLLLSPLAKGKFTGVIGSSGSALAPWGTAEYNSLKHHLEICHRSGCYDEWVEGEEGKPTQERLTQIYACMRDTPEHILRKALSEYEDKEMLNGRLGFDAVSPSIQHSEWITTPKFLAKPPAEILRNKEQNPVNLIMGANRHDGSFFLENIYNDYLVPNGYHKDPEFLKNKLIPRFIPMLRGTDKSGAFPDIVAQTYFGNGTKNGIFEEMLPGLIDVTSIWGMKAPAFEHVQKQAQVNPNSYYYAFDFLGFWSTCDMMGEATVPCGVPHIDDMSFTFQIFPHIRKELEISQRMVQYFVNFAYYGTPNNISDPNGLLYWKPYDDMTHPFLKIDMEDSIGYNCRDSWIDNSLDII